MKFLLLFIMAAALAAETIAQNDLEKMVEAEKAFAAMGLEQGPRAAFLANMTGDAIVFVPDKTAARAYWTAQAENPARLVWAPNFADISANGIIGYTTGNWEFRPKGADDTPGAFGTFITIWLRQPDGTYKWGVDIGVTHDRPERYSTEWTTTKDKTKDLNEKNISASDAANGFFALAADRGLAKAYDEYLVDDARGFREKQAPLIGKKSIVSLVKGEKAKYTLAKRSTFFGSADIAYNTNTYTKTVDEKVVEKGNTLHIWKLIKGKWRIVLEVFKAVP